MGDLYDLTVLFPQKPPSLSGVPHHRQYTPGHGAVGPGGHGDGELLECSALIKLGEVKQPGGDSGLDIPGLASRQSKRGLRTDERRHSLDGVMSGRNEQQVTAGHKERAAVGGRDRDFWAGHTTWRPYYALVRSVHTLVGVGVRRCEHAVMYCSESTPTCTPLMA